MLNRAILWLTVVTLLVSCKKANDECVAPNMETNIVGKWSASWNSSSQNICQVEFKQDGTYIEDKDLLLGNHYSPNALWTASKDSLTVSATYSIPATTTYVFSIDENSCNEIILDLEGQEKIKLSRK
jgi:hypothetical protein